MKKMLIKLKYSALPYLGGHFCFLVPFEYLKYAAFAHRRGGGSWNTKRKKTDLMGPTSNRSWQENKS